MVHPVVHFHQRQNLGTIAVTVFLYAIGPFVIQISGRSAGAVLCGTRDVIDKMPHLIKVHGGSMYGN